MRDAARSIDLPLDRTWKGQVPARLEVSAFSECGTVRTMRVKLVGTPGDGEPQHVPAPAAVSAIRDPGTTQRVGCMPGEAPTRQPDAFEQALAFARTIPAMTPEELGFESSGVREIERLELWLEPRDRAGCAADSCRRSYPDAATLRIPANPLTRAWQLWHQLPAPLVLCAAATLCVLSALALGFLSN